MDPTMETNSTQSRIQVTDQAARALRTAIEGAGRTGLAVRVVMQGFG